MRLAVGTYNASNVNPSKSAVQIAEEYFAFIWGCAPYQGNQRQQGAVLGGLQNQANIYDGNGGNAGWLAANKIA